MESPLLWPQVVVMRAWTPGGCRSAGHRSRAGFQNGRTLRPEPLPQAGLQAGLWSGEGVSHAGRRGLRPKKMGTARAPAVPQLDLVFQPVGLTCEKTVCSVSWGRAREF